MSSANYIRGVGMAVPERVVPNSHFESYLETSDEWIRERTGIEQRRWSEESESLISLSEPAARAAIQNSGLEISDIDGIVLATVTPDYVFPSSACVLQSKLGIKKGFAFDVNAVCTGFIYALATADSLLARGLAKNLLVVGADLLSQKLDHKDRGTCILFGDGAGAVVLSREENSNRGVLSSCLQADGGFGDILTVPHNGYLHMNGREVFKVAVRSLVDVTKKVLDDAGVNVGDLSYIVTHQANKRILDAMSKQLGIEDDKVLANVATYGNTSAASVPILLAESVEKGIIKEGDLVLLSGVGGGMTWGAILLRW